MKKGYVYFIAPEALLNRPHYDETKVVKIGFTRSHPLTRLKALQTGCPLPLKVWAYIEGTERLERAFHEAFAEMAVIGEWFWAEEKLEYLMSYFGEEPNVGNLIPHDRLAGAMFDVVFHRSSPHPSVDMNVWMNSANPEPLIPFFPDEWAETIA